MVISIAREPICVWAGAGLSVAAGMPLASAMQDFLLGLAISESSPKSFERLSLEAVLDSVDQSVELDWWKIFQSGKPTSEHKFIARALRSGMALFAVTTNFDCLIERAYDIERESSKGTGSQVPPIRIIDSDEEFGRLEPTKERPTLVKIHGSASKPASLKSTVARLTVPGFRKRIVELLQYIFTTGPHTSVIVLGYAGHDELDVNPAVHQLGGFRKPVTIVRHTPNVSGPPTIGRLPSEFADEIFNDSASAIIRTETRPWLGQVAHNCGWDDVSSNHPSQLDLAGPKPWQVGLEAEMNRLSRAQKALLSATLRHTLLNMVQRETLLKDIGLTGIDRIERRMIREFELSLSLAEHSGEKITQVRGNFALASWFRSAYDEGSPRWNRAPGHAMLAKEFAIEICGGERGAALACSLQCATMEEQSSHDARLLQPEYQRLYELAKGEKDGALRALIAVTAARGHGARGEIEDARTLLDRALKDIETYGRISVVQFAYVLRARLAVAAGATKQAAEAAAIAARYAAYEGGGLRPEVESALLDSVAIGVDDPTFDNVISPDLPPLPWS